MVFGYTRIQIGFSSTCFTCQYLDATENCRIQTVQTKQAVQTVVCSLENSNCYSSRDTDNFIHDLSRNRLVLCGSFQPEEKKVSLLINYFAPRWTLNRSKKLCWELVFDRMIGSTTNSRFRYLSSTLRSRSQLTCRINYLLHPTILSFYFHDLLERISCFKEICLTQPEMGAIL